MTRTHMTTTAPVPNRRQQGLFLPCGIALAAALACQSAWAQPSVTFGPRAAVAYGNPVPGEPIGNARDLRFATLAGLALTGPSFEDRSLWGADLRHTHWAGADLRQADLRMARLQGASFTDALLPTGAWLSRAADVRGVRINRSVFDASGLAGRDLSGADFSNSRLNNVQWTGARLDGANLSHVSGVSVADLRRAASVTGVQLAGWQFGPGSLAGLDLSGASFNQTTFMAGALTGARLQNASFEGVVNFDAGWLRDAGLDAQGRATDALHGVNLAGQRLNGANLRGLDLTRAKLDIAGARVDASTRLKGADLRSFSGSSSELKGVLTRMLSEAAIRAHGMEGIQLAVTQDANGLDLRMLDFSGANLKNANLSQARLTNAVFDNKTVLTGADLSHSDISIAQLRKVAAGDRLEGANLSGIRLDGADLQGLTLKGVSFNGAELNGLLVNVNTNLSKADLRGAMTRDAKGALVPLVLSSKDLQEMGKSGSTATDRLVGIRFGLLEKNVNLSGLNVSGADLSRQDLSFADLQGTNLKAANLSGAKLSSETKFSGKTELAGADLRNAVIVAPNGEGEPVRWITILSKLRNSSNQVDLSHTRLGAIDLANASLAGFFLEHANLQGANLVNADLTGVASLAGTDLRQAVGLTASALRTVGRTNDAPNNKLVDIRLASVDTAVPVIGMEAPRIPRGQNYRRAEWSGLNLSSAKLERLDLREASLDGSSLDFASLRESWLAGTSLVGTRLRWADLRGADLSLALTKNTNFQEAVIDAHTRLPGGVDSRDAGMWLQVDAGTVLLREGNGQPYRMHDHTVINGGTLVAPEGLHLASGQQVSGWGLLSTEGTAFINDGVITGDADNGGLTLEGHVQGTGRLAGRVTLFGTLAPTAMLQAEELHLAHGATLALRHAGGPEPAVQATTLWLSGSLNVDFGGASFVDGQRIDLLRAGLIGGSFADVQWQGLAQGVTLFGALRQGDGFMAYSVTASVAAVPEPTTMAMLASGLLVCAWLARRRRKSS